MTKIVLTLLDTFGIDERTGSSKEENMSMRSCATFMRCLYIFVPTAFLSSCYSGADPGEMQKGSVKQADTASVYASGLKLQELTNSCGSNQAQQFFKVSNGTSSPIKLADLKIKFWVNETSVSAVVGALNTSGCISYQGNPSCVYQVPNSKMRITTTQLPSACGPDAAHQANWEITIESTDTTTLPAGGTWSNIQAALHLANYANFAPGSSSWYSPCLTGTTYQSDSHFSLYHRGALVYSSEITAPDCRAPHGTQRLTGYVSSKIASAPLIGAAPSSDMLQLSIGIPVRDAQALRAYYKQIADLKSPTYGQRMTPDQFVATFSPTQSDYDAVASWARSKNLEVVKTYPNRMLLNVSGTVSAIEQAFYVNIVKKMTPDGREFYAPDREPSLDLGVSLLRISGIETYDSSRPLLLANNAVRTGPNGRFWGTDYRNTYLPDPANPANPNSCLTLDGTGQAIGLMAPGADFDVNDITSYQTQTGLPVNAPTRCCSNPPIALSTDKTIYTMEVTADIEMAYSMAPNSQVVVFQSSGTGTTDTNKILFDMIAYNADPTHVPIYQFSSSFGMAADENTLAALETMAVMGQSFFLGSGDSGAYNYAGEWSGRAVGMPLTLVGMTRLAVGTTREDPTPDSGGGIVSGANGALIPDYQVGLNHAAFGGSAVYRNAPDVTMIGDNMTLIVSLHSNATNPASFDLNDQTTPINQYTLGVGGTSLSSPLWAGFMALTNQRRMANALPPVGFANPALYTIGQSGLYAGAFNDVLPRMVGGVSTGIHGYTMNLEGRPLTDQGLQYAPVAGYDLASGWGSPQCGLIDDLTGPAMPGVCGNPANQCRWSWPGGYTCATGGCNLDSGCCESTPPPSCPIVPPIVFSGPPVSGCQGASYVQDIHAVSWDATTCHYVGEQFTVTPCSGTTTHDDGPYTVTRSRIPTCGVSSTLQCQPSSTGGFSCPSGSCDLATGCCAAMCPVGGLQCQYNAGGAATCPNGGTCNVLTGCCPPPTCPTGTLQCQSDAAGNPFCAGGGACDAATGCCAPPTCTKPGLQQCVLDSSGNPSCAKCDGDGCCELPSCPVAPLQCAMGAAGPTCNAGAACNNATGCCPMTACSMAGLQQCQLDASGNVQACPGGTTCDVATGCCPLPACSDASRQCQVGAGGVQACADGSACDLATGCCPIPCPGIGSITLGTAPSSSGCGGATIVQSVTLSSSNDTSCFYSGDQWTYTICAGSTATVHDGTVSPITCSRAPSGGYVACSLVSANSSSGTPATYYCSVSGGGCL